MGEVMPKNREKNITPFNGPLEIGLRMVTILNDAYPIAYSLQRLVFFDYLVVHSDDIEGGPKGLHPKTPHRSGELLVRRDTIQRGLYLYMSKNLIERQFKDEGVHYAATEYTGSFLDTLEADYCLALRERSAWVVDYFNSMSDTEVEDFILPYIDKWGAEFENGTSLWMEESI